MADLAMVTWQRSAVWLRFERRFDQRWRWTNSSPAAPTVAIKLEHLNRSDETLSTCRYTLKNLRNGVWQFRRVCAAFFLSGTVAIAVVSAPNLARSAPNQSDQTVDRFAAYIAEAANRFAMPEHWIRAVMQVESAGQVQAVSSKGAMGLMQIMPETWAELRDEYGLNSDPFWPRDNILAGAAYLRMMHDRFGSPGFLAAYNAGPHRFEQFLFDGRPLPQETIHYVMRLAPMIGADPAELDLVTSPSNQDWRNAPLFIAPLDGNHATRDPTSERLQHIPVLDASDDIFVPPHGGSETQ